MKKKSIFITTATIGQGTGGGNVAEHELAVLSKYTDVVTILSYSGKVADNQNPQGDSYSINPVDYNLPNSPYLCDYIASHLIEKTSAEVLFINGNPFSRTVETFQHFNRIFTTKVIVDVPAHDLQESIDEHQSFGIDYAKQYPHMVQPFLWRMQTEHIGLADKVICPSEYSKQALLELPLYPNTTPDIVVIPHGTHIPQEVLPASDTVHFGNAGVFGPDKGQLYLARAFIGCGFKDSELRIAGSGTVPFQEMVTGLARQPNVNNAKFRFLGYLPSGLDTFYDNISVYVQPSVTEGFGLEVLEAMAYGRPVIVSDGAGASELVENGVNGFVFPKRDVNMLTQHMRYFHDNPSEIRKFGAAARKKAEQYSWDKVEEMYAKVIE